ncbi:MAG TPA: hybrid sensor histidine kinase/response regulator, partial [Polyangiales bacterium]|nr:hybrid sensor histidine kinase/response regulator [Polyangiales bacterium]
MAEPPPSSSGDGHVRLHRCIRDLAALNALPSMCVGRSPDEAFDIILDALPTALSCDLVYIEAPGPTRKECAVLHGARLTDAQTVELKSALATVAEGEAAHVERPAALHCMWVDLPMGRERGRLVTGRSTPFEVDTDRVLIRSAANLTGATLQGAHVLDSANRKDEFLAKLGHELRSPLAPILTAVELLNQHPAVARERDVIDRHTRHLARLVDDLLDISRVTRGFVELRSERVSLDSVLQRALEIVNPLVSRNRHTLRYATAPGVWLQGDHVRLAQVFGNLLTNAAKFTAPGGTIELSIASLGDRVRVSVRDNGRGIARDKLAHIFQPFVQADRDLDALRGGLGLGLAIVDDLVKRHGGTISVHSDGPARGSTFTVDLPTAAPPIEPARTPAPKAPTARNALRVLVVDDNVDLAELLSEALRREGFQTAVEYDARTALERWQSFVPHAAVLDVGLPEVDGYDLAKALRAEHGRGPLLIAATGYAQNTDRLRAADAG